MLWCSTVGVSYVSFCGSTLASLVAVVCGSLKMFDIGLEHLLVVDFKRFMRRPLNARRDYTWNQIRGLHVRILSEIIRLYYPIWNGSGKKPLPYPTPRIISGGGG